jgi:hypothetical protein
MCCRVAHGQAHQERYGKHTVVAPVHIVAQEQVVCHRTGSAHAEELEQVLELACHNFSNVSALVH